MKQALEQLLHTCDTRPPADAEVGPRPTTLSPFFPHMLQLSKRRNIELSVGSPFDELKDTDKLPLVSEEE